MKFKTQSQLRASAPDAIGMPAGPANQMTYRPKYLEASAAAIGFLVLFLVFAIWLGPKFSSVQARLLDVHQNVPILLLGLAAMITLVAGCFDLSISGVATLTTFLAVGLTAKSGWPFWIVLIVCVAVGLLVGAVNGFLVEYLGVTTFIATLATGAIATGVSAVYSGGTNVVPAPTDHQLPQWFNEFGSFANKVSLPIMVIIVLAIGLLVFVATERIRPARFSDKAWTIARAGVVVGIAALLLIPSLLGEWLESLSHLGAALLLAGLLLWILLEWTPFGRNLRAVGSNRVAAELAGVRIHREVVAAFMIGGVLSAFAGVCLAANQGSAAPDVAGGFLLPAFAAAFLSTAVFSTGRFTVWGTLIGGIFVVWVAQALIVGGLPGTWISVINGFVLAVAVALSTIMRRRR